MTTAGVEDFIWAIERDDEAARELFENNRFYTALSLIRARFANLGPLDAGELKALNSISAVDAGNLREACQGAGLLGKER